MGLDWKLFALFNGLAGRSPVLDRVIQLLMNDYAIPTALVVAVFGLWFVGQSAVLRERNQRAALSAAASLVAANLLVKAFNLVFYRFRPFAFHQVNLLFYYPSDSSFPSNAAAVGFSIATAVWLQNRRVGWLLYALAALFAGARVCGGVHYPADIVGGALIGIGCAYVIVRKVHFLDRVWSAVIGLMRRLLLA
jgi:undecaprenyl-diphosphatase